MQQRVSEALAHKPKPKVSTAKILPPPVPDPSTWFGITNRGKLTAIFRDFEDAEIWFGSCKDGEREKDREPAYVQVNLDFQS